MLYFLTEIVFKFVLYFILTTIAYNVFLGIRYYRNVKFSWYGKNFFLPCFPFIGTAYVALFTGLKVNLLSTVLWMDKHFGMPLNFWHGHKYHYLTDNAEEVRFVLNHPKCLNKSQFYDGLNYVFKNTLFMLPAEEWKTRRRYLRPAFKTNMLNSFVPTFYQQSCVLIDKIKTIAPQEDLFKFFNKHAFVSFFLTSAGLNSDDCEHPSVERFGILIDSMQDESAKILLNPICPAALWLKTPAGITFRKNYDETKHLLTELLLYKKQQREEEYIENPAEVPLIDLLLAEKRDIVDEFVLFAAAATDTTGHTLAFCFTLLGMHPDIQQQVYEEVVAKVGNRYINIEDVHCLKYTEMVICETLRILPSIPMFGRYCSEDIDIGTKILPKGSNIIVSAYHLHRRADYWEDPLKFDPLRFSPEKFSKIVPGSYVPFSVGPRNCIGQGLVTILLKITVANVIRNYQITSSYKSVTELSLESCISMKTLHPLDCKFILRVKNRH